MVSAFILALQQSSVKFSIINLNHNEDIYHKKYFFIMKQVQWRGTRYGNKFYRKVLTYWLLKNFVQMFGNMFITKCLVCRKYIMLSVTIFQSIMQVPGHAHTTVYLITVLFTILSKPTVIFLSFQTLIPNISHANSSYSNLYSSQNWNKKDTVYKQLRTY